jgi:Tfp pilus assembly protein FimT
MVVSIITIVAGVTVPSFTGYMKNQTLKNAQDQFKNDLRSIENMALTGSKYDTNVTCGTPPCPARYWVVKWSGGGTSSTYQTYLMYDFGTAFEATCVSLNGGASQQANYSLPGGITFDRSWSASGYSTCSNECLFFNMQDGSTRFVSYASSACTNTNNKDQVKIVLKNESGSTAPVSWNRNGMIGN